MIKVLWDQPPWKIVWRSYCNEYSCLRSGGAIDLEGPATGHWHTRGGFRARSEIDCVVLAFGKVKQYELRQLEHTYTAESLAEATKALAGDLL